MYKQKYFYINGDRIVEPLKPEEIKTKSKALKKVEIQVKKLTTEEIQEVLKMLQEKQETDE